MKTAAPFSNIIQTMNTCGTGHPSNYQGTPNSLQVEQDIEKRIMSAIAKDGIRLKEFFIDFDKLRKGVVGEAAFRTCLGTLKIELTEQETQELIRRYQLTDGTGLIRYKDFIDKANAVFSDQMNPSEAINASRSQGMFTEDEREQMLQVMQWLNQQVVSNRILLKNGFQDFDRSKQLHITQGQFLRVLKTLNLMPPNPQVYDLIIRKYCDRGNNNEVNYFKFIKDVDRPEDMFPQYLAKKPEAQKTICFGVAPVQVSSHFKQPTQEIDVINNRFQQQRVDILSDPQDVEDRLRAAVVMKRVRIEEFFRDFDKLRKGRVTRAQFKSVLSSMNFTYTDDEFEALANKYQTNDPERFFKYTEFIASINKAFTTTGIDKNPTVRVAPVTQNDTLLARRKYLTTNPEQMERIEDLLEEYRTAVKNKRIHLKPIFQDFDITKNGHVTKAQFLRVLDLLSITAPASEMQMLLRRYMDKGNVDEVNYVDFTEDIDNEKQLFGVGRDFNHSFDYFPKTQARVSKAEIVRNTPADVEDVLARIRQACSQQRIRVGEFFRDFDRLRSGFITAPQFRIGLNMAKVAISAQEFEKLCETFKAPKEGAHIKWREFVDAVDEVFTKKGLEKQLDAEVGNARTNIVYGRAEASEAQRANVQRVLDDFTEFVRKNRLDAKSFFQDFDRHKHFKVSPKVFRQVLTALGFPLLDNDAEDVAQVYGNQENQIMYAKFLQDANCLEYIINGPTTGAKSTYVEQHTDFNGETQNAALIKKIQNFIMKDRLRLLEFFQDHDILRKGYVPQQKFRGVLHSQRISLTDAEYTALEAQFAMPDPKLINYVNFCKLNDTIFTDANLEKEPTKRLSQFKAPSILDPKDVLNEAEEQVLMGCLARLGEDVKHRRLLMKPHFQDKDKTRAGFINFTRFRSIFDNFKMRVSEEEYAIIAKRFAAKAANEINYVEFDHVLRHYSGDHQPF